MSESLLRFAVQGTLILLVIASVLTWALVLVKGLQAFRVRGENARFRKASNPETGLPPVAQLSSFKGPVARLAQAAVVVWQDTLPAFKVGGGVGHDLLERRLKQQIQRERGTTERGLAILASIGTTSPFIGLFGTVWGIMGALGQIGSTGSAGLEVVAGPIGEALVATGIGIAVAVPAVLAFNFFVRGLKTQAFELEDFANSIVALALQGRLETTAVSDGGESSIASGKKVRRAAEVVRAQGSQLEVGT